MQQQLNETNQQLSTANKRILRVAAKGDRFFGGAVHERLRCYRDELVHTYNTKTIEAKRKLNLLLIVRAEWYSHCQRDFSYQLRACIHYMEQLHTAFTTKSMKLANGLYAISAPESYIDEMKHVLEGAKNILADSQDEARAREGNPRRQRWESARYKWWQCNARYAHFTHTVPVLDMNNQVFMDEQKDLLEQKAFGNHNPIRKFYDDEMPLGDANYNNSYVGELYL